MLFIDLFAFLVFAFLAYYVLFRFILIFCSSTGKIKDIEKRNYTQKFEQNLNIVVYAYNHAATIINTIESLKKQDYDKEKYSINVILDNCEDNSSKLVEILGGTRIWRVSTDIKPLGKSKSIVWFLERILSTENTNAFIFINADCTVKPDFLSKVNAAIYDNPVLIGELISTNHKSGFITGISCLKNKFNRIYNHGRSWASLYNFLEAGIWAVRQDMLEKIKFSRTDVGFEEYEYSLKLAKSRIQIVNSPKFSAYKQFADDIKTIAIKEYQKRYKRLYTLKTNFNLLFSNSNLKTKELMLSALYPSGMTFTLLVLALYYVSTLKLSLFASIVGAKNVFYLYIGYIISIFVFMISIKSSLEDFKSAILWLFISPIEYIGSFLARFRVNIRLKINFPMPEFASIDKQFINVRITDGKKELPCTLEIKQGNNNSQVIFRFNDKKLSSAKYPRVDYALNELIEKLKAHGFALKVCMNCGYFREMESANFDQGHCVFDNVDKGSKAQEITYIWNYCSNIIPTQAKDYIQQQLDNKTP